MRRPTRHDDVRPHDDVTHDTGDTPNQPGHAHDDGHEHGGHEHGGHEHGGHEHGGHEHERAGYEHGHEHHGGVLGVVLSLFSPHDHGDSADRALESTLAGIRTVFLSLAALAATATVELVVALVSHSVALLADTIHNFADALTAVPLALAFRMGRRAPTRRYTYGFGRAEDLAGVAIVAIITASAVVAAYEAISRLAHPHAVHSAGWVIAAGAVGFAGNELVATYRIRVGSRIGSAALVADGLHARSDGFTSLAVVAGAAFSLAGEPLADPVAALVITVAVSVVLLGALRTVYRRLMDSVDPDLVDQIDEVLSRVPGVERVGPVRVRWVGHELRAEIMIDSDPSLTLVEAHAIAEDAHHTLLHEVPRLREAVIHSNPAGRGARTFHEALSHHFPERVAPARSPGEVDGYTAGSVGADADRGERDAVVVEEVTDVTPDVVDALVALVPVLSSSAPPFDAAALERIVRSDATVLLVARDEASGAILGSLTLVVFSAPTGPRAWIEDVVVSPEARGGGIGAALVNEALARATAAGSRTVDLTSRPSREAANRLYMRLGFHRRETNVYRRDLA